MKYTAPEMNVFMFEEMDVVVASAVLPVVTETTEEDRPEYIED